MTKTTQEGECCTSQHPLQMKCKPRVVIKHYWLKELYDTYSYSSLILHGLQKVKVSWVSVSPAYYAVVDMSIDKTSDRSACG